MKTKNLRIYFILITGLACTQAVPLQAVPLHDGPVLAPIAFIAASLLAGPLALCLGKLAADTWFRLKIQYYLENPVPVIRPRLLLLPAQRRLLRVFFFESAIVAPIF